MPEIDYRKELRERLKKLPREVVVAISARAAFRVAPFLGIEPGRHKHDGPLDELILATFRAILTATVAAVSPGVEVRAAAATAARGDAVDGKLAASAGDRFYDAVRAAHQAAAAASADDDAGESADAAAYTAAAAASASFWSAVREDVAIAGTGTQVESFLATPMWHSTGVPNFLQEHIERLNKFLAEDSVWHFWAVWYGNMDEGNPMNWEMQREIVLIPDEVWKAGPEPVAERIAEIEARRLAQHRGAGGFGGEADLRVVSAASRPQIAAMIERLTTNRDVLAVSIAGVREQIAEFRERFRGINDIQPEVKTSLLNFLDNLTDTLALLNRHLAWPNSVATEEQAVIAINWLQRFQSGFRLSAKKYLGAENIAGAVVPTGIILGCTVIGSLLGQPIAGSVVGGLITNQMKPGQAAERLTKSGSE